MKYFNKTTKQLIDEIEKLNAKIVELKKIKNERDYAEEAQQESEAKYFKLFDNMLDGFSLQEIVLNKKNVPIDYVFIDINDAFEDQTGLKREKIIGKKVTEVLPGIEHDPAGWIERYGKVALKGKSIRFENYSEQLKKWYSVSVYSPQKGYFATIFQDITERMQAEEELKATNQQLIASEQQLRAANQQLTASEQQLRAANQQLIAHGKELRESKYQLEETQEIAGLGSYVLDISSGIWKSSSILDNIFGLDKKYKKDISGWLQIIHPEDKTMMQDYFATNVLINHELFNKEYRIKRINDQQERWVHGMGKLEFNDDEDPIKMIGTIQDITERKQAEEKFKLLSLSVEQSTEGMAHADLNGNLIYINKAWCEMHGYKSSKNLLGKNLKIFHNKKQLENDVIPFNEEVKKNGTCSREVGHITKEGKTFPTLMTSTLLEDAQGNPFAMVGIARDITERKRVEEKLISRNKELELFNEVTVDRELKMIELKKEINELLEKSGEKPKYKIII